MAKSELRKRSEASTALFTMLNSTIKYFKEEENKSTEQIAEIFECEPEMVDAIENEDWEAINAES